MSDNAPADVTPDKPLYDLTSVLGIMVDAFNASRYRRTGEGRDMTIRPEDLTIRHGLHAQVPPGYHYRRVAIMLADHFGNNPEDAARAFGITGPEFNSIVKGVNAAVKNGDPKYLTVFDRVRAQGLPEKLLAFAKRQPVKTEEPSPVKKTPPVIKPAAASHTLKTSFGASAPLSGTTDMQRAGMGEVYSPRVLSIDEVSAAALIAYNKAFKEDAQRERLNGQLQKGTLPRAARAFVSYVMLKCLPKSELNIDRLGIHFDDNRSSLLRMDYQEAIRNVRTRGRMFQTGLKEAATLLKLSPIQESYLKAPNDTRFESWQQVFIQAAQQDSILRPHI